MRNAGASTVAQTRETRVGATLEKKAALARQTRDTLQPVAAT
jgi:hypothetical protein